MHLYKLIIYLLYLVVYSNGYEILAVFPHSARSHHIYFSALVEELALRQHNVTVINYHPVQKIPTLRQISLQNKENASACVDIEKRMEVLSVSDFALAYATAKVFKNIANTNCKKLMNHREVQELIESSSHFDLVIVEQFVTDCGLAVAYKLNAPAIGIAAHILSPWTYPRLGAPNNPAYVPNHFFGSGSKPTLWNKIKSLVINLGMNMYYTHVIQRSDQEIVNEVYPDTPLLEELGKNMSLILINQYFPLTGPRLYSSNVVEVGGLHINLNDHVAEDEGLLNFLDSASNGVVYISFGSVASNFPRKISNEIMKLVEKSNMRFVWKTDISDWVPPSNVLIGKWMPQTAVLCHPNVVGFISHSGMLSTSEAMHCGVPLVSVPLFGEQFANGRSAVESGLGVLLDVLTLNVHVLEDALKTILQEQYQKKAKTLSKLWKDRPLSPMETAIFWIEYVARNKEAVNLKPPTLDMPLYQYLMIDVLLVMALATLVIGYIIVKLISLVFIIVFEDHKLKGKKVE
uniref:UDP-glucuronosyltransferase n=1 Tax=Heliothis virescens TaxID=7102 RepID=A0A2A4JYW3_HELVI